MDHLKREITQLMLNHVDPSKLETSNRAIMEKHLQLKQEAAHKNF